MSEPKDYARRFVKGSTIVFAALLVAGVTGLFLRMFLMRSFEPGDYGLFFLAFALVSFLVIFRDVGLNLALAKHIPEFMLKKQFGEIKSSIATVMLLQILLTLPITLVLFFFSDQISIAICGTLAASIVIKIFALWFFVMLFYHVFRFTFQGLQDMKMYAVMEVAYIIFISLLVIFAVRFFYLGVKGVAFAYLVGALVLVILLLVIFHRRYPEIFKEKIRIKKPLIKKILVFALPVFVYAIGGLILAYTDTIMIGIFHNTTQVGYYQGAQPLATLLSYFSLALTIVLFPMISELWARRKKKLLGQALHFLMKFSFLLIIPAALVFIVFPGTVLLSFTGRIDYLAATVTLQILAGMTIVATLGAILQSAAAGIGKPIIVTKVVGGMACLNFFVNLLLIPPYGIEGAAIATFISSLVGVFLAVYFLREFIKFTLPTSSLLKMIVAGVLTLFLIFGLKSTLVLPQWWIEIFVVAIPSLLFYAGLVLVMKAISKQDLELLKGVVPIPKRLVKIMEKIVRE